SSRTPTAQTLPRAAKGPEASEELSTSLAPVRDLASVAKLFQGRGLGRVNGGNSQLIRQALEDSAVSDPRALELEGPGVRRLMSQRVFPLGRREMRGDRDAVRPAVANLAARQLAA